LGGCKLIKDLSPIINCRKIKYLNLNYCNLIVDISPIKKMSLTYFGLNQTKVRDLSPIEKLPLIELVTARFHAGKWIGIPALDYRVVKNLPLMKITLILENLILGAKELRESKTLKYINGLLKNEFFKEYDAYKYFTKKEYEMKLNSISKIDIILLL
jgi:hypothetical protein